MDNCRFALAERSRSLFVKEQYTVAERSRSGQIIRICRFLDLKIYFEGADLLRWCRFPSLARFAIRAINLAQTANLR